MSWQFEQKGVIMVDAEEEQAEELALLAIDEGADDFETFDSTLQIYSTPNTLEAIRATLEQNEAKISTSEISMVPSHTIALDDKAAIKTLKLLDLLEDLDDVQKVYSNADFSDEALEQYSEESE